MVPPEATRVTVLRHGAVAGPAHVFRGALDDPLSPEGRAAVLTVATRLAPFDRIASSPRRRCQAVAAELAGQGGLPLEVVAGFAEMHFGAWEGLTAEQAAARDPDRWPAWRRFADSAAAPGGETLAGFRQRVRAAWQDWTADAAGGHRLLLCHAGVMRVLLQDLLAMDAEALYRIALPEAAHFQVSLLPGHPPVLLNLNPCADSCSPSSS